MRFPAIKHEIDKLEDEVKSLKAANYEFFRDDEGNLQIKFYDNNIIKLPVVNLRSYQLRYQHARFVDGMKRFFLVLPRRAGKEVISWNILIQAALTEPGLYLIIYPTNVAARRILWDGAITMPDGRSVSFKDMIPKRFIRGKPKEDEMKIHFKNGSILQAMGADSDPDKLRGSNPRGVVHAEYAFQDPRAYQVLMPVLTQNKGWVILQTTYNGMNHAWQLMQKVKDDPEWFCAVESVETLLDNDGNRYITDDMIEQDRRNGMPEFLIKQEYYSIVTLNEDSMYFSIEMARATENKRIKPLPYLNSPVYSAWDLGQNDTNSVTVFQVTDEGNIHIIYYFEGSNKTFEYYADHLKQFCYKNNLVLDTNFAPHDGGNGAYYGGSVTDDYKPKDIRDFGRDCGMYFEIVHRPLNKVMAIQAMRLLLYKCYFDSNAASRLVDALCSYEKEYDKHSNLYKNYPKHNWASHPVDSFQSLTLAFQEGFLPKKKGEIFYYNKNEQK